MVQAQGYICSLPIQLMRAILSVTRFIWDRANAFQRGLMPAEIWEPQGPALSLKLGTLSSSYSAWLVTSSAHQPPPFPVWFTLLLGFWFQFHFLYLKDSQDVPRTFRGPVCLHLPEISYYITFFCTVNHCIYQLIFSCFLDIEEKPPTSEWGWQQKAWTRKAIICFKYILVTYFLYWQQPQKYPLIFKIMRFVKVLCLHFYLQHCNQLDTWEIQIRWISVPLKWL